MLNDDSILRLGLHREVVSIFEKAADSVRDLEAGVWLRAADALHLVSARDNGFETIFSNDRHLLAAAPHFVIKARNVISTEG